ncbi:unnamed protein product, partial [Polarella glacialis]
ELGNYQAIPAAASLVLAVAIACLPIDHFAGRALACMSAVFMNFADVARSWMSHTAKLFDVLEGKLGEIREKLGEVLDTVREQIAEPKADLQTAFVGLAKDACINQMVEDQKPTVEQMQKFEKTIRAVDSDFDIPTPDDLQEPLQACDASIDGFISQAKSSIPGLFAEEVGKHPLGRLATQRSCFKRYIVYLPLGCVLLVNVLLAALQLSWTADSQAGLLNNNSNNKSSSSRRLRGMLEHEASVAAIIQNITASPPTVGTAEAMAAVIKNITPSAATIGTDEAMEPSSATLGTDEAMERTSPGTISSNANRATESNENSNNNNNYITSGATESNESSSSAMVNETVIQSPSQPWGEWLQSNLEAAGVSNDTATKLRDLTRPQFWAAALRTRLWSVVQPVLSQILLSVLQLLGGLLLTRAPVVCSVGNKAIAQLEGKLSSRLNQQTHEVADKVFGQTFGAVKERSDSFFPKFKKRTEQLLTVMQSAQKANAMAGQLGSLLGRGSSGASGGA